MSSTVKNGNQWRAPLQVIPGMRFCTLVRVLRRNRFRVDRECWGRAGYLLLMGALNSTLYHFEEAFHGSRPEATGCEKPPLFIVGHWRSGTTHLFNLMGQDEDLDFPTTYEAIFPHHYRYSHKDGGKIFDWLTPGKRPMDNVAFRASTPHEDEFAVAALCGISPYLRFLFPRTENSGYASLDPLRLQPEALESWKDAFTQYLGKLSLGKRPKRLLLKSPPHMGRIAMLLDLFPGARFVHIVRNPYDVYLSTKHLWKSTFSRSHLQTPDWKDIEEIILSWYEELFFLFERDRHLIPAGALHEVRYEELELDPLRSLEGIYNGLGLTGFERFRGRVSQYLETLKSYKKNAFRLDDTDREQVRARWHETFVRYGYPV
ncbi:MAG: sulfotransferase [Pseudomonadota bacterium]